MRSGHGRESTPAPRWWPDRLVPGRYARRRLPPWLGPEAALPSPSAWGRAQRRLPCRKRRVEDRKRHLPRSRLGPRRLVAPPLPRGARLRQRSRREIAFHGDSAHLADPGEPHATLAAARGRGWAIRAERPLRGPAQFFHQLSRHTHRSPSTATAPISPILASPTPPSWPPAAGAGLSAPSGPCGGRRSSSTSSLDTPTGAVMGLGTNRHR